MVGNLKQASVLLGAVAATTLCTAVASVIGIVPRFAEETSVRTSRAAVATELAWMDREAEVVQELLPAEAAPTTTTTTTVVRFHLVRLANQVLTKGPAAVSRSSTVGAAAVLQREGWRTVPPR